MAHNCNPSYSGGGVEGSWFKASLSKISMRSYLKNKPIARRTGACMAQVEEVQGPEFNLQYHQKKKENK
jgi:hypothetical protein